MATSDKRLTAEEIANLQKNMDSFKSAQKQVTDALSVLWNAKLEFAIATGDPSRIEAAIGKPVAFLDDCDCNQKSCEVRESSRDIVA